MLLPIQILHKLGSKDSIFPKAFENNNMHFFLEGGWAGWSAKQSVLWAIPKKSLQTVIVACSCLATIKARTQGK